MLIYSRYVDHPSLRPTFTPNQLLDFEKHHIPTCKEAVHLVLWQVLMQPSENISRNVPNLGATSNTSAGCARHKTQV